MTFEPPKRPNAHRRRWSDRVSVGPLLRETWSTIAHGHSRTDHLIELARPHTILLIVATILFGLVSTSCAGVHSHFALPELAAEEPSFLPTVEAYTSAAHGWMGDGRTEGHWRDTDVRMEGPIVASLIG